MDGHTPTKEGFACFTKLRSRISIRSGQIGIRTINDLRQELKEGYDDFNAMPTTGVFPAVLFPLFVLLLTLQSHVHLGWPDGRRCARLICQQWPDTVNRPPERIEGRSSEDRKQGETVLILNRPAGFFEKAVGLVVAVLLLALAFVFSLIVFAILAAVVLVLLVSVWWARKRAVRTARSNHGN